MGAALFMLLTFLGGSILFAASNPLRFSADCDRWTGAGVFFVVGMVLGSIAVWVSYQAYKDGPNRDMRFIAPAALFIAVVFGTLGVGLFLNELFDASPAVRYEGLAVTDSYAGVTADGPDSFHVEIQAPPEDTCSPTWRAGVPKALYNAIKAGRTRVMVDIKAGAFGFQWVKKVSIVKPPAEKRRDATPGRNDR